MKKKVLLITFIILNYSPVIDAQWYRVEAIPAVSNVPSFFMKGDKIYAGADSVVYISPNRGSNWTVTSEIHPDVDFVSAVAVYENFLFAGTYNHGVFLSTNEGISWIEINVGLTGAAKTIRDFIIREDKLYAGTIGAGVYYTDINFPGSWFAFNTDLPFSTSQNINGFLISDSIIYAGGGGNGYYYTNISLGSGWVEHHFGEMTGQPLSMYDILFTSSSWYLVSSYGIHKSTDFGLNWEPYNFSNGYLETGNFVRGDNEIFLAMSKPAKTIWYKYNSSMDTWEFLMEVPLVNTLNAIYADGKIFDGRLYGLWYYQWKTTDAENPEKKNPEFYLSNNFPNPFNPDTKIYYSIPSEEIVQIKIYNSIGEEISTIVNEIKNAGDYEVFFSGNNLPAGIYFYRISAGYYSTIRKMVLLK